MVTSPLIPTIDYTSRDYSAIRADMIRLIRARLPQWTANNPSDFGVALVEAYAYGLDIVNYYLDRVANEAYLSTAVQRESLYSIAEMFNYTPRAAEPASVTLEFANSSTVPAVLPPGTRCQATVTTGDGIVIKNFEILSGVTVPGTSTLESNVQSVRAIEGRTYTDEAIGVSNGFVGQRFLLPRTSVLPFSVNITTDLSGARKVWTEVLDLGTAAENDRVFQVKRMTDGSSVVLFGNGQHGAVPDLHSVIRATYRVGGGTSGNVAANSVNALVDPVVYGVSVNNPDAATGGVNAESLESIRINAARSFRSRDRAVTLLDYVSAAESCPGIAKAKAVGNNGSSVTLYCVPDTDAGITTDPPQSTMTDALRFTTIASLNQQAMAGVTLSVFGPSWVTFYVRLNAYLIPAAYQSTVETEIRSRLAYLYRFQNVGFDDRIVASDISAAMTGIEGVQYVEVVGISLDPAFTTVSGESPTKTILMSEDSVKSIPYYSAGDTLTLNLYGGIGVSG